MQDQQEILQQELTLQNWAILFLVLIPNWFVVLAWLDLIFCKVKSAEHLAHSLATSRKNLPKIRLVMLGSILRLFYL